MYTIGITGGIGSGKSVVSSILQTLGIPVYDTDQRAKALYNEDEKLRQGLIDLFGEDIYMSGILNRKKLASIIFSDTKALEQINKLVHPAVRRDFVRWREELLLSGKRLCGIESAIMLSSVLKTMVDEVWVITADEEVCIQRAMHRDGVDQSLIKDRIRHQMSQDDMISLAQEVIYNNPNTPLLPQILTLLKQKFQFEY